MLAPSALRQLSPDRQPLPEGTDVDLDEGGGGLGNLIDKSNNVVSIEYPDGSIKINLSPSASSDPEAASKHDENLALHIGSTELATVASDLITLIEQDSRDQAKRLSDLSEGLKLLGVEYEMPKSEPNEEGMSVVRHPLLLEAVLTFQANCRGEMLPASGPVKVRVDGGQTEDTDKSAQALETDFNHYLTVGAPEYYPDTDRMFFSAGFAGEAYKKVYHDPVKNRPVSLTVDRKDLILANGAVAIAECKRITHRLIMTPPQVKRMQLVGAWRDVELGGASHIEPTEVDTQQAQVSGVEPSQNTDPKQADREIYECYCEFDLPGFEHKDKKGKESGLAVPYRVTLDKTSKEVLEIRRWWKEQDDDICTRKEVFVDFVFVPMQGGLNIGLFHILCNATRALTAAWRIALDNGMLANFPGGLIARAGGRQQTSNIRIAPGQLAPVDVMDGMGIKDSVMPLPYRDVTGGFMSIMGEIQQGSQRLAGTANQAIGEGKQEAPVGTTIALIEQATQVVGAVHKRMHQSQTREFGMLKELFREDPEAFFRGNPKPAMQSSDHEALIAALDNSRVVPAADPNTASQTMRIQKAIAVKTLASQSPQLYDMLAVDKRVLAMLNIEDADELFSKLPPQPQEQDQAKQLAAQAAMTAAQAKVADVQLKAKTSTADQQVKLLQAQTQAIDSQTDAHNRAADRESHERLGLMQLAKEESLHPGAKEAVDELFKHPPNFGPPTGGEGPV